MSTVPPLADVDMFSSSLTSPPTTEADTARARICLDNASALVRDEAARTWLDPESAVLQAVPPAIVRVVLAVARRDYLNPEGAQSTTKVAGPFSNTSQYGRGMSSVYLLPDEKEICARYRPAQTSGLWALSTTRGEYDNRTLWLDDTLRRALPRRSRSGSPMAVMFGHGVSVTVIRPGGVDDFGQPLPGTSHTLTGCALAPRFDDGREDTRFRDQVIVGLTLYAPSGADITPTDLVEIPGGVRYAVEGEPGAWLDPFTGWSPGTIAALKRVTG